jgi:hypothetical protein
MNRENSQHLALENTYVKYRYNELIEKNKKLENKVSELNDKLEKLYKSHANLVIILQEKKQHIRNIINRPKNVPFLLFSE